MAKNLKPVKKSIYAAFVTAAENVAAGSQALTEWVSGTTSLTKVAEQLSTLAKTGDEGHVALVKLVNATFVTPFDRTDIYQLSANLDQVMDHIESVAGLAEITGLKDINTLPPEIGELITIIASCARLTVDTMSKLKSLKLAESYWVEITRLEDEADLIHRALLGRLFDSDLDHRALLKLRAVGDELENTVNAFENVAHTVEAILIKES